MPLFDAITTMFGTAGTGGFGIRNDSIASYSPYLQWVITIFMILFGVNFNVYYLILRKRLKSAAASTEVRVYFVIVLTAILFDYRQHFRPVRISGLLCAMRLFRSVR